MLAATFPFLPASCCPWAVPCWWQCHGMGVSVGPPGTAGFGAGLCRSVWVRALLFHLGGSWASVVVFCCHPTPFPSLSSFHPAWHRGWGGDSLGKARQGCRRWLRDTEQQLGQLVPPPGALCWHPGIHPAAIQLKQLQFIPGKS